MKQTQILAIALVSLISGVSQAKDFALKSSSVRGNQMIANKHVFNGFGCSGENISPELSWTKGPEGTRYYAVTMYDPDAPSGSGWWHWTVVNIPPQVTELKEGASGGQLPEGSIETRTDFGKSGYGGPCPPQGDKPHHYIFKVFALKDKVPVDKDAPGAMVGFYTRSLKLAEASLTAKYGR